MSTRSIRDTFASGITLTLFLATVLHATPPQNPIYRNDEVLYRDGAAVFAWVALFGEFRHRRVDHLRDAFCL